MDQCTRESDIKAGRQAGGWAGGRAGTRQDIDQSMMLPGLFKHRSSKSMCNELNDLCTTEHKIT